MKKAIILVSLITLSATNCISQTTTENRDKFMIGIKAGTNLSNVYDSQGEDFVADAKFGLAAGGGIYSNRKIYWGSARSFVFSKRFQIEWNFVRNNLYFNQNNQLY